MSGHKPGPWTVIKKPVPIGYADYEIAWSPDGELVCDVVYEAADARLIAASPDLLAVAKAVMDAFDSYERFGEICPFEGNPMISAETLVNLADVAREAIAKATGEHA